MSERQTLELEVAGHAARVEQITSELRQLEELADAPAARARQAAQLRMELRGRTAAVALGSARLKMIRD